MYIFVCISYFLSIKINYIFVGTIASFNWDTSASSIATSQTHLSNQYYDICIRRTRSYCSVCYSPVITSTTIQSSYGLGASSLDPAQTSAAGSHVT